MKGRTALIAVVAALVGAGAGYLLPRPGSVEYQSVAYLVDALAREDLFCEGEPPTIGLFRGVDGNMDPFENGGCSRFAGGEGADFFTFDDSESLREYVEESQRNRGIRGVVGSSWIVGVPAEDVALRVQEAIGGELVGY